MNPREDDNDLMELAAAIFHGRVSTMDANGNYSGIGFDGQRIIGALTARPYGFRSYAPANTGMVVTHSQAGLLVLSQHGELPSGVSEPLSGEALLYNSQGATVHLDENGDIVLEPKSGEHVKLGSGATKALALHQDNCPNTESMAVWMSQVEAAVNTLSGSPPGPPVVTPLSSTFGSTAISTVSASATKAKGE